MRSAVAVHRQSEIVTFLLQLVIRSRIASQIGVGLRPPKSGLWRLWMKWTRQRARENRLEGQLPHAVHRIHDQPESRLADHVHVDQGFHRINIFIGKSLTLTMPPPSQIQLPA